MIRQKTFATPASERTLIKVIEVKDKHGDYLQLYMDNYGKKTFSWIDNCYSAEELASRIYEELKEKGW